jgi:hypothetical protein
VEIDPATPGSPLYWDATVSSVGTSGPDEVSFTDVDFSVGWDAGKRYMMISQEYSAAVATQRTDVYQADDADGLIEDLSQAYEYGYRASNAVTWTDEDPADQRVALYSSFAYGDGAPLDVGYERDICRLANNLPNYRTAPMPASMTSKVDTYVTLGVVRRIMRMRRIVVGIGDLGAGDRVLWVAPFFRSGTGGSVTVRITLCKSRPYGTSFTITDADAPQYRFGNPYESNDWTTSSTTWTTGAAYPFSLKTIGVNGKGWLVVEATANAELRGEPICRFGPYEEL